MSTTTTKGFNHVAVNDILDRHVRGTYDLAWYTASDLYWEQIHPRDHLLPPGLTQRGVIAEVQRWMDRERCECRGPDPADPCGHGETSEGCPVHDPNYEA